MQETRDVGSIPGSERSSGEGIGRQPTPACLPGEAHGQRSLAGYSLWVTKSQTRLKRLSTHKHVRHSVQLLCWNLCLKKYSFSIVEFLEMTKATWECQSFIFIKNSSSPSNWLWHLLSWPNCILAVISILAIIPTSQAITNHSMRVI